MTTKITPPKLAKMWGVGVGKVLSWVKTGELAAIDVATRRGSRPRYLISWEAIAAFEASRAVSPASASSPRRRRRPPDVIEFF